MIINQNIVTVTILIDLLAESLSESPQKPRYMAIAEAISTGIREGKITSGTRLPPQRDLADRLRVTVGTVSRAYTQVEGWGLIRGEVGRGTYVREPEALGPQFRLGVDNGPGIVNLSLNTPAFISMQEEHALYAEAFRALSQNPRLMEMMHYEVVHSAPEHRLAGVSYLSECGVSAITDEVLLCAGSQHAISVVFGALARPGDVVLMENLTYPGAKAAAALHSLQMHGLGMDREGIIPEALEAACQHLQPRLLYTVPTIQNPTTATMSLARRQRIVEIARRHDLLIVEDDIHALMPQERIAPLAALYPEKTLYIASLSKTVAPALRIAYLKAPIEFIERLSNVIQASVWMISPIGAKIATTWVNSGQALRMCQLRRDESARRQELAARRLLGHDFRANPHGLHLWLNLPEPWRAEDFVVQAQRRGVLISSAEAFVVGRMAAPHGVRVALSSALNTSQLETGLEILATLLESSPALGVHAI